jgi:hypothetical protein
MPTKAFDRHLSKLVKVEAHQVVQLSMFHAPTARKRNARSFARCARALSYKSLSVLAFPHALWAPGSQLAVGTTSRFHFLGVPHAPYY